MKRALFFLVYLTSLHVFAQSDVDFLYRNMPLCDRADYPRSFFEANADMSRRAMNEQPWGTMVNDTLFRHFVLPLRVNNEPLDSFRLKYYETLRDRVSGLTMTEAAIAVNHWCHEHVTYQPTDGRTSSPLQSIRTAYGRCGEESTLCVAAMRTVGIPARQVYTPRWAHCDDNHAWVEVWTDGAWHFLGACEPEPVLDLGWFNAPASRGMLMHTCVFGDYHGEEDVVRRTSTFTEINVTPIYAPTRRVYVRALLDGEPVSGARVEFKIYNYAEFFSAVTVYTDGDGKASLVSGYGDLLVWVSKGGRYGYHVVDFATDSLVDIALIHQVGDQIHDEVNIHVPRAHYHLPAVTAGQRSANDLALTYEDSLRRAYEATMPVLPNEATETDSLLWRSRGNSSVIRTFISRHGEEALPLLRSLSEKDLHDVTLNVLEDHFLHCHSRDARVLSPRVALEPLVPWREVLQKAFHFNNVKDIRQWCDDQLTLVGDSNLNGTYVTPIGVLQTRRCDVRSRKVFFVAVCRAMGIAAWLDPVTGEVCTEQDEPITNVVTPSGAYGTLRFVGEPTLPYSIRFTVARLTKEGTLSLLTFPEEAPLGSLEPKALPVGEYILTTGTRRREGDVLASLTSFRIEADRETVLPVVPRVDNDTSTVYGHIDGITSPVVLALIAEGHEPSNHVVRDICSRRTNFNEASLPVHFVFASEVQLQKFQQDDFAPFPVNTIFAADEGGQLAETLSKALPLHNASNLPLVVFVDGNGDIRYYVQGYTIGIGDALLQAAGLKE